MANKAVMQKTVTVLLTEYHDSMGKLIWCLTGRSYTHASISLDGVHFFSFKGSGFCSETPRQHVQSGAVRTDTYQIAVTDEAYAEMQGMLDEIKTHSLDYSYSTIGAFLAWLGLPLHRKKRAFCSQFVAMMLEKAMPLKKDTALYLPSQLPQELEESGCLLSILSCTSPAAVA